MMKNSNYCITRTIACRFGLADLRLAEAVGAELAETEFHGDETIAQQAILGRSDRH